MAQHLTPESQQALADLGQNTIYLMGGCFVLGSLFTLFLLLILDFIKRSRAED